MKCLVKKIKEMENRKCEKYSYVLKKFKYIKKL